MHTTHTHTHTHMYIHTNTQTHRHTHTERDAKSSTDVKSFETNMRESHLMTRHLPTILLLHLQYTLEEQRHTQNRAQGAEEGQLA